MAAGCPTKNAVGSFFIRAQKLQFLVIENVTIQLFRYEKII